MSKNVKTEFSVDNMINDLVTKANKAKDEMLKLDQEAVDKIVAAMAKAGLEKHIELAKMAVEETNRGVFEDKVTKNIFATEYIYNSIKYTKTVGVIEENDEEGYMMVAEPIGVVAGVTPVTNPTSTTMFKALISIKGRNPIIFSFHPSAQKCSAEAARILRDAAIEAGAPENCIQWIETPSLEASSALMKHNGVALILATGGPGMVKSAYSSGKPALGVGAGNVPCFIEKSADIKQAVNDLILSKTFDNGMICASEQAVIVEECIYDEVVGLMKAYNCYFVDGKEKELLEKTVINPETKSLNPNIVGQTPYKIAQMAGFEVPKDAKMLVAEIGGVGMDYPLSKEKLSPVLACIKVKDAKEGIQRCVDMTEFGGLGHSAVIHSNNDDIILEFSKKVRNTLSFMPYAEIMFVSALTGQRLPKLFEAIEVVIQNHSLRIATGVLNEILTEAVAMQQPPSDKGRRLKIYYMTQVSVKPPTFVIFVNDKRLMHFSYTRYLENKIREAFGFAGTPLKFIIRERKEK